MGAAGLTTGLWLLVASGGCVVDADDRPRLSVVSVVPADRSTHPADQALRVTFDRYLVPGQSWDALARVSSGEWAIGADVGYDPVGPSLVISPHLSLRVGLGYRLAVAADDLRADRDARLSENLEIRFVAGEGIGPTDGQAPGGVERRSTTDFARDVRPVFRGHCGCHQPDGEERPRLEPDGLIDEPSRRAAGMLLVVPGQPLRSHLVHKILPDYPGVAGLTMPPGSALPKSDQRRIVEWVRDLVVVR